MALKLVSSGTDLAEFKDAVSSTPGRGTTELELDLQDKVVIPFFPDIPLGSLIRAAIPGLDAGIRAIPGVHLKRSSTYTVRGGTGILRIELTTNPLVLLPVAVPTLILVVIGGLSAAGISAVIAWRIFRAEPAEAITTMIILAVVAIALVVIIMRPQALAATAKAIRGG